MRKSDKKLNMVKINFLAEQRFLESKGLLDENVERYKHWKQRADELDNLPQIKSINNTLNNIRNEIYKDFDGMEIKPVFSNIRAFFLEEINQRIMRNVLEGDEGDIVINYNDEYYLFKPAGMNGDNIKYAFAKKKSTKSNVSHTAESRKLISRLDGVMSSGTLQFRKEEIPNKFTYNKF